jgi:tetratricopeptide (TPR) repeat protein
LTGEQARTAGYPLPVRRRGGPALTINEWEDVGYVIGRRKRIAYIDLAGNVQDSSYHNRLARWGPFPAKNLDDCAACHFTGPLPPEASATATSTAQGWTELDIGCEACHGPGGEHARSLEAEDILLQTSSALCGSCHTRTGKVLPDDDLQAMHDFVQNWNSDPHATSTRDHSFSAFCARCHTPDQGHFSPSQGSPNRRIFSEHKQAVTCIGCHNPHELTNPRYYEDPLRLQSASLPRLHTYRGDDGDFTTTDFQEHETVEQVCEACHSGADRVDLDHAGAQCIDCHNSYQRNRTAESRIMHDSNQPKLSCQPCHRDSDHLITVLYQDPEFLSPSHIHNLQSLPIAAREKHGLNFAQLDYSAEQAEESYDAYRGDGEGSVNEAVPAAEPDTPVQLQPYLALARVYAQEQEYTAALELIDYALALDAPAVLLELGLAGAMRSESAGAELAGNADQLAQIIPRASIDQQAVMFLPGLAALYRGQYSAAIAELSKAAQHHPENMGFVLYLGLAQFGAGQYAGALKSFNAVLADNPGHVTATLASSWVHFVQQRPEKARKLLADVLGRKPANSAGNYLSGLAHLRRGDSRAAIVRLRTSLATNPAPVETWFRLAQAYRSAGEAEAALGIYEEILARHPAHFDSRFEMAGLLKLSADSTAYRYQNQSESPRPPNITAGAWDEYLASLTATSSNYSQLALSEYSLALRLRPADPVLISQVSDIYRRTGRLSLASRYFRWLTDREPNEWLYFYRLGTVLIELERYEEAVTALLAAQERAAAQGDIYFALGLAYTYSGQLEEAITAFQRGTVFEPFNPGLYTNLGAIAGRLGQYSRATEALSRSLELASFPLPRVHLAHTNLAFVHLAQGRREEAIFAFKRALHAFPNYQPARHWLTRLSGTGKDDLLDVSYAQEFVVNDFLQRFGEVSTVAFDDE